MTARTAIFSNDGLTAADLNALAGARSSFTPAVSGWTLGDGTVSGRYAQFGYHIEGDITLAYGSTTDTNSSGLLLSLPVTPRQSRVPNLYAYAQIGSARYHLVGYMNSSAVLGLYAVGTAGLFTAFGSSTPAAWASGDDVYVAFEYEANSL